MGKEQGWRACSQLFCLASSFMFRKRVQKYTGCCPPTTSMVDTEPHPETLTYPTKPAVLAPPPPPDPLPPDPLTKRLYLLSKPDGPHPLLFSPCTCTPHSSFLSLYLHPSTHASSDASPSLLAWFARSQSSLALSLAPSPCAAPPTTYRLIRLNMNSMEEGRTSRQPEDMIENERTD